MCFVERSIHLIEGHCTIILYGSSGFRKLSSLIATILFRVVQSYGTTLIRQFLTTIFNDFIEKLNAKRFFKKNLKTLKSGRRFGVTLRHYQVKTIKVKTRIYKDVKQ